MTDAYRFVDLAADQLDDVLRVRARSFGPLAPSRHDQWLDDAREFIDDGRFFGVVAGDEVVAAARIWDFNQWWAGRQVRTAGVAGVVVAPEHRGRGVGSRLMRGLLERSREKGFALSALYPATVVIYRGVGYEYGGGRYRFSFPAADLRRLAGGDVSIRRAGADDAGRILELVARSHAAGRTSGLLGWPLAQVTDWLSDEENFAYLADDGFVVYTWDGSDLRVDELLAGSEATARALWSIVGSGSSIARTVNAYIAPHDPVHLLLGQEADKHAQLQRWMLRLLDAPAAIAARGWSPGVSLDVELELTDVELPGNAGRRHLSVESGQAELTPSGGSGAALRLGPRGLAALYAGTPLATLRTAGLATGGSTEDDGLLDTAFAGPAPYMVDYF